MSQILSNLNLNKNELQNAVLHPLATAPANPKLYQIYTDSATGVIKQYLAEGWQIVGAVYNQANSTGAVLTGIGKDGTVKVTDVIDLTLEGYTPLDGGYVTAGMTMAAALKAIDTALKNVVSEGGEPNQNAFSNINIPIQSTNADTQVEGQTAAATISATAKTDTFIFASGDKWSIVHADPDTKTISLGHAFSGATAGSYGDATHVAKITVDKAGHITAVEAVEIVGAEYIKNLTSDAQAQIDDKIPLSQKGQKNGVASLDENGLVPSAQLPSYVDDVVEAYVVGDTALAAGWLSKTEGGEALTPETDKIYVVVGPDGTPYLNKQYRWGGTTYVECNPSDVNSVNGKTGIVTPTQDDVLPGETYTQFAKTDKEKLDAIDDEATKNTITMNGAENKNPSFYAPTDSGTVGQVLVSGGENAAPTWQAMPNHLQKYSINNPVIAAAGGAFTWTIAAQENGPQTPMLVQIYEAGTNEMVMADVTVNADNSIVIKINQTDSSVTSLAAGTYKAVAIG